ncbi:glycosyltransferase [Tsuneonella amylolytica]|uniref:glycosyltransferase n=1 Tax=Tsuneonella amylolytica TaxID=2338327 RepID=UPI000EA909AF|nr:glycosyltransferase family 2 protein [Tsuneonella amylolytica]
MSERQKIGVVVIGRNEGERLKCCLRSIPTGLTTVYVDSASTDGSVEHARSLGTHVVELDLAVPFTAARARNEGAARLLSLKPDVAFIQFVDGDCEFETGWLSAAKEFLTIRPDVAVVCGRRSERFPEASFYNALADREWDTPVGEAASCGGDAMLRALAFREVGGFDAAMIAGEEPEMCSRLRTAGWKIWRLDCPMTVHDADMHRFRQWWLRTVRGGFGYAQVWDRTRLTPRPLYARSLARALFWTLGVIVLAILLASLFGPRALLAAPIIWFVQWVRLSMRTDPREAGLLVVGKIAETVGAGRFLMSRLRGRRSGTIFYK